MRTTLALLKIMSRPIMWAANGYVRVREILCLPKHEPDMLGLSCKKCGKKLKGLKDLLNG